MRNRALAPLVAVAVMSVVELGSQAVQPAISIVSFPAWGQDGNLTGFVSGVSSQHVSLYLFAFTPDLGWYGLPGNCQPLFLQNGQFSVNATPNLTTRSATRFSAYLIPASLMPPCDGAATATIPFLIQHNALASATYPRLAQYSTLTFGGLDWYVKEAPAQVFPGPQFFVRDNAFVDSQGQLHLKISRCGGAWCAAEVYTRQNVGYGTYQFTVNTPVNTLDPNVTLGFFSWDAQAGDQNNREWDVEFSRWGNPGAATNAQYVVQPYTIAANIRRFLITSSLSTSHQVTWDPSQVAFTSSTAASGTYQWNFFGSISPIPTPDDVRLHINFYVGAGQAPYVAVPQEIVIGSFRYQPSGPQTGFSRTSDNIPFQGQTYNVPLTSTSAACNAIVESDSPWLSILGSNTVPAGATLQYSVLDNIGPPRSGNLILRSTTCNASLVSQVLTITQAGLVCAPAFAASSTHLGFLPSLFSVMIKGTAPACSWNVSSSAPWLRITSPASGGGDGTIQLSADTNLASNLRGAVLTLANGPTHSVYQDASGSSLALSPLIASSCGSQTAQFGLSWNAPSEIEIHLNLPTGPLVGRYASTGTTTLSNIADGTLIFMVQSSGASPPVTLASVRSAVAPSNCGSASIAPLGIVNAASFSAASVAAGGLATIFGANLSTATARVSGTSYAATLGGVTVVLGGQACPLSYVSPTQINFQVPSNLSPGRYLLTVGPASSEVIVAGISPGIFTVRGDGTGVPFAAITAMMSDGSTLALSPYQCSATGCSVAPVQLPSGWTDLYIVLYGTGIRSARNVSAALGQVRPDVDYAGAQDQYPGLDQVNLRIKAPASLVGLQSLQLNADGVLSNSVTLEFP